MFSMDQNFAPLMLIVRDFHMRRDHIFKHVYLLVDLWIVSIS